MRVFKDRGDFADKVVVVFVILAFWVIDGVIWVAYIIKRARTLCYTALLWLIRILFSAISRSCYNSVFSIIAFNSSTTYFSPAFAPAAKFILSLDTIIFHLIACASHYRKLRIEVVFFYRINPSCDDICVKFVVDNGSCIEYAITATSKSQSDAAFAVSVSKYQGFAQVLFRISFTHFILPR